MQSKLVADIIDVDFRRFHRLNKKQLEILKKSGLTVSYSFNLKRYLEGKKDFEIVINNKNIINHRFYMKDDVVYNWCEDYGYLFDILKYPEFTGIFAPYKGKKIFLVTGDEGAGGQWGGNNPIVPYVTMSFNCLDRFYPKVKNIYKLILDGTLKIINYCEDTTKELTKKEKAAKNKKQLPPPVGFSYVSGKWHRAATILFKDTKSGKNIILGQDEGTYFGCEFHGNPQSLEDAFTALMPFQARGVKGVLRQGEWFLIPVDQPPKDAYVIVNYAQHAELILPLESKESNSHYLSCQELVVSNKIYAKGIRLSHDQHRSIETNSTQWYFFAKNTALRSFSEEGVD